MKRGMVGGKIKMILSHGIEVLGAWVVGMFGDVRRRPTEKGFDRKNMNKEYGRE